MGQGLGVGKWCIDQQALPLNPTNSTTLRVQSKAVRNVVTLVHLLSRSILKQVASRMMYKGGIETEANALL
jgi:hypothetical protein